MPGYQASNWYGMAGPLKMPAPVITKLNREFALILATPDIRDKLLSVGMEPTTSTPAQFGEFVRSEIGKWAKVVKAAGVKAE